MLDNVLWYVCVGGGGGRGEGTLPAVDALALREGGREESEVADCNDYY